MSFYDNIYSLSYEYDCTSISVDKWESLMENATKGSVYEINRLVRDLLPDLFHDLALDTRPLKDLGWFNPYCYYKTLTHLVLVHSGIEYFLRIN